MWVSDKAEHHSGDLEIYVTKNGRCISVDMGWCQPDQRVLVIGLMVFSDVSADTFERRCSTVYGRMASVCSVAAWPDTLAGSYGFLLTAVGHESYTLVQNV